VNFNKYFNHDALILTDATVSVASTVGTALQASTIADVLDHTFIDLAALSRELDDVSSLRQYKFGSALRTQ